MPANPLDPRACAALADEALDPATAGADPIAALARWYDAVRAAGVAQPEAMTVATVRADGTPDARTVLLRGLDERGLVFYTNLESAKGEDLALLPQAACVLHWREVERQVRVRGHVELVADPEADAYWATRPRGHRIGAWASPQSRVLGARSELEELVAAAEARFAGTEPERPAYWGGWRVVPHTVELWQGRRDRLHDRVRWTLHDGVWRAERLAP